MSANEEKAVSFAASMIRKGTYMGKAINVAANYYKVERSAVQKGLASRSGASQKGKKREPAPSRKCEECGERPAVWRGRMLWGFNHTDVFMCESCGQRLPSWWEGGQDARYDSIKWTKYRGAPKVATP